jgi:hypothetical protein
MRNLKELLQLILKFGDKEFRQKGWLGLCAFNRGILHMRGHITIDEYLIVKDFIGNNRPRKGSPHYSESCKDGIFYWTPGKWAPRKRWLEDQINSL